MANDSGRRQFIKKAAQVSLSFMIVPRHVLGKGFVSPSDKLIVAGIGVGGEGEDDLREIAKSPRAEVAFLCDVDDERAKSSVKRFPRAKYYKDFRELLDQEHKHIDAVTVSTPDHTHAVAALSAMQLKKHVYVQKPLTHDIYEARILTQAARRYEVVTQMGNQGASGDGVRQMMEWHAAGLIGDVIEIHCWTNRPIWPQGIGKPLTSDPVPASLDWNLWLGPNAWEPYRNAFVPFNWRGFPSFGTGALGDMGCHIIDPAFRTAGLGYASEVECSVVNTYDGMFKAAYHPDSFPIASSILMKFPIQGNGGYVHLHWMDGGLMPDRPEELPANEAMGDWGGGAIITGTKGKIICSTYGADPKLLPSALNERKVPRTLARVPEGHYIQWVNACLAGYGKAQLSSPFDYAGPLTETILMGNLALQAWNIKGEKGDFPGRKKLLWDAEAMRITNFDEANQFVRREYHNGYHLSL